MKLPNLTLMQHYGTAGVFREKTAGASPFASRVAAAVFTGAMISSSQHGMALQQMEAHQLNEQFRLIEQRQMAPALDNLRHTRAPMFVPAGSDVPVGWDEGMVRLASIAHDCGSEMAKHALQLPPPAALPKTLPGVAPQGPRAPIAKTMSGPATVNQAPMSGPSSSAPVNPDTGRPMSSDDRARLISKIQGMKAQGAPPTQPMPAAQQANAARASGGPAVVPPAPNAATQASASPAAATLASKGAVPPAAGGGPGMMEGMLGKNWKGKALGWGAMLGGGYLALKGVNAGLNAMSRPAPPQQYGGGGFGGYQVPLGVNQYGYPQGGTSLVGS